MCGKGRWNSCLKILNYRWCVKEESHRDLFQFKFFLTFICNAKSINKKYLTGIAKKRKSNIVAGRQQASALNESLIGAQYRTMYTCLRSSSKYLSLNMSITLLNIITHMYVHTLLTTTSSTCLAGIFPTAITVWFFYTWTRRRQTPSGMARKKEKDLFYMKR